MSSLIPLFDVSCTCILISLHGVFNVMHVRLRREMLYIYKYHVKNRYKLKSGLTTCAISA